MSASSVSSQSTVSVGTHNPIELVSKPSLPRSITPVATGHSSALYSQFPDKIIKVYPIDKFQNGDVIRIIQIAARLKIAPKFYEAYVANDANGQQVVAVVLEEMPRLDCKLDDLRNETKCKLLSSLFAHLKTLLENNISYHDVHLGNVTYDWYYRKDPKHIHLIDFDDAQLCSDSKSAQQDFWKAPYPEQMFKIFEGLGLYHTDTDNALIRWFRTSRSENGPKKV